VRFSSFSLLDNEVLIAQSKQKPVYNSKFTVLRDFFVLVTSSKEHQILLKQLIYEYLRYLETFIMFSSPLKAATIQFGVIGRD
jgi:hypothetical protein